MATSRKKGKQWIGVDLDRTLAHHTSGQETIGRPLRPMQRRVKGMIERGEDVRILTARPKVAHTRISDWTEKHIGKRLPVTNKKDPDMKVLYDDRVRQVVPNNGTLVHAKTNKKRQ